MSSAGAAAVEVLSHGGIRHEDVRDQRQPPSGDLDLRRVAVQRRRRPAVHESLSDQRRRDLEDDRGDIPSGKEVLSVLKRLRIETSPFSKNAVRNSPRAMASPANRSGARPAKAFTPDSASTTLPRLASGNKFSIRAARCRRSGRTPHFKALRVSVIFVIAMEDRAKAHFERELLARIAIEIEAERVQTFLAERIGGGLTGVRIHGHGHDGRIPAARGRDRSRRR